MNIVIITTHYPNVEFDNNLTAADHYYAREWVKSGHNVLVFHLQPLLFGFTKNTKFSNYMIENVLVYHASYLRLIPKSPYTDFLTNHKVAHRIIKIIEEKLQYVDLFYCDFCSGNWGIISKLKGKYESSVFFPVFNNCDFYSKKIAKRIVNASDIVGVRSKPQKKRILEINKNAKTIITYSGAPIEEDHTIDYTQKKPYSIVYVGDLIPLKNVDILIDAIKELVIHYPIHCKIIGDGEEEAGLRHRVITYGLDSVIEFTGRKPRTEVLNEMKKSEVFVMVSSPESFGIVYVEAMSQGCFVVACKGEGIDGVILDGVNGALVTPRSHEELVGKIDEFYSLNQDDRDRILSNSYTTGLEYSERNVARKALNDIMKAIGDRNR